MSNFNEGQQIFCLSYRTLFHHMKVQIIFFLLFSPLLLAAQNKTTLDHVRQLKQARLDTMVSMLHITASDIVADIGTGNGYNLVRLSRYYPSIRYYAEDIDSSTCNRSNLQKMIKAHNPGISVDSFVITYGTTTSTHLPRSYFTKVLMTAVLHECEHKKEMLADIRSILKPGGLLFIEEPLTPYPMPKEKECNLPYLTEAELRSILQQNGIEILQEKLIPDTGNRFRKFFKCAVVSKESQ